MPCPTLIVIDMQPNFEAAGRPKVISGVTREIIQTKMAKGSIIFVEYEGFLPTYTPLLNLVKGYPDRIRVKKKSDDGSKEVIRTLEKCGDSNTLRICGVNIEACVWATVEGLVNQAKHRIEVVKDACGCEYADYDWRGFLRHRNLSLV